VEVIKGSYSLRYGQALGGVINFISEKPVPFEKFEIHTNASIGYESNWDGHKEYLSIYGGNKKAYFKISGGNKNYGNYESGKIKGKDSTFKSAFKKYFYSIKFGYDFKKNQQILLTFSQFKSKDVMYPALPMDEVSDNTQIVSIDYRIKEINKKIKSIDFKIYRSDVNHIMDNRFRPGYDSKQMIADVDAINTGGRGEMNCKIKENDQLLLGLDFENINKDGQRVMTMQMMGMTSTKKFNLWNNALVQNGGVFATYKTFFSSYLFTASIRGDINRAVSEDTLKVIEDGVDYFNEVNSLLYNLSANIGVTKNINKNSSISLVVGRGVRSPNMLERYIKLLPVGYDNYDYLGNPQLKSEVNYESDITFNYAKENIGKIYLNGFYSYVTDYIAAVLLPPTVITPQSQGVLGVKQFSNVDNVILKGFEFGYYSPEKNKIGGSIVASYTYGTIPKTVKYIISGNNIVGKTNLTNDALPEIPPLETNLKVYYKFLKGSLIPTLSARIVADQRHVSEAFYEPYTPGYGLLNFSIFYKINAHITINTGVDNIFNRAYYEHLNRKIVGTNGKLYEPGRVFFVNLNIAF